MTWGNERVSEYQLPEPAPSGAAMDCMEAAELVFLVVDLEDDRWAIRRGRDQGQDILYH